jgi:multisubunit Na+/H+ antiporter MnhG subunit
MTLAAGVAAASMVIMAPLSAQAITWGLYYNGSTPKDTWHQSSASHQRFTKARTTAVGMIAFVKVPNVATSSGESPVTATFSSRIVQPSCKFQVPYGFSGNGQLKCENGY